MVAEGGRCVGYGSYAKDREFGHEDEPYECGSNGFALRDYFSNKMLRRAPNGGTIAIRVAGEV